MFQIYATALRVPLHHHHLLYSIYLGICLVTDSKFCWGDLCFLELYCVINKSSASIICWLISREVYTLWSFNNIGRYNEEKLLTVLVITRFVVASAASFFFSSERWVQTFFNCVSSFNPYFLLVFSYTHNFFFDICY